jgi:hypothetical protein
MSRFWQWVAEARDDIRHEVVERPWYGREVTQDSPAIEQAEPDLAATPDPQEEQNAAFEAVYGQDIEQPEPQPEPEPIPQPEQEP